MKLTAAEKEYLKARRERIRLGAINWYKESYVTARDLLEMSASTAYGIVSDPLFRYCPTQCVYYNMRNDVGANDV